jgi:citrate lyase subunit beta / citryl-CoA lyase
MPDALTGPALLFCPADRPDRYRKALEAADMVIIDLEDAVAPEAKSAARESVLDHPCDPRRTIIRINAAGGDDHQRDLEMLRRTDYQLVMLPKTETRAQVESLAAWSVIALCETPHGILNLGEITGAKPIVGVMWGSEDLIVALNGRTSRRPDGVLRDVSRHARATTLVHAAAAGIAAIDSVYVDITAEDGLLAESEDAAASGFAAKACIHPRQAALVRQAYRPTGDQLDWARRVLDGVQRHGTGAIAVDGEMVDSPTVRRAETILRLAARN